MATLGKDLLKKAEDLKEEDLTKYLAESPEHEERRSVREFRDDFAKLLSQTKRKRLVVVIDDLDRCLPETIIETLEAIKLFLFVNNTAFIIGADERLVKYAVRRRFPELPGERTEVGRDYLEKLIQFPIRIPPLGRVETEKYVSLLFALRGVKPEQFGAMRKAAIECDPATLHTLRFTPDVATKVLGKVEGDFAEDLYLAERIAPILAAETVGNPRQCKRFMNMMSIRLAMAQSRGVKDLKPRVLAKLMLLEYYRTESFRQLAAAQAEEDGKPRALADAEKRFREETTTKPRPTPAKASAGGKAPAAAAPDEEEAPDLPLWLLDPWVIAWARSEPALAGVDLRPYFYFSRDTLGPLGQATQRMSPAAQEVFKKLLSQSDAERKTGLARAATLPPADASAIFEALAGRIREDDDFGSESSAFGRAIDWAKARRELVGQLAPLLANLPEDRIPPVTPMKLVDLGSKSATDPVAKLFTQWQRSSNLTLKNATEQAIKRLT
jgi:predicted KAP-like P-loop ATPase